MTGTIEECAFLYANNDGVRRYVDQSFGGLEKLRKDILVDFFRHAFDGSGADNFFDAGSCIGTDDCSLSSAHSLDTADGRLTSAWNWCSKIDKKHYYPIFKLTGFIGSYHLDWQELIDMQASTATSRPNMDQTDMHVLQQHPVFIVLRWDGSFKRRTFVCL